MSWSWMAGDLVSTTRDLDRFFHALLTGRLLRRSELAQMQTTVPFDPAQPFLGGYGLGLYVIPAPCGPIWGHDGLVFGHSTISLHTPNASRQVTIAHNMTHYAVPGDPDPIAQATGRLILEALSPATALRRSGQWPWRSLVHDSGTIDRA